MRNDIIRALIARQQVMMANVNLQQQAAAVAQQAKVWSLLFVALSFRLFVLR